MTNTPFRDNKVTTDPDIEYRRVHYQNLFNQLELSGIILKVMNIDILQVFNVWSCN